MRLSTERILTTHVGSLPRPQDVVDLLFKQDKGEAYDAAKFEETMRRGVGDAVNNQAQAGIDIINDGEMAKIGYATYMRHRLTGFELGDVPRATPAGSGRLSRISATKSPPRETLPNTSGPFARARSKSRISRRCMRTLPG